MNLKKTKVIAYYLPQFHPTEENDQWWSKGFTEWTNVGKAKKLYKQHEQPKVPADLGYYDLRLPDVREQQAELANEAGIDAFCYWHYWFGNGKRLLNYPFDEVIRLKTPNFPFCLAWGNHSWFNKTWKTEYDTDKNHQLLAEQTYPGKGDYDLHFYTMLEAFKDSRYYKIDEKLVFVIYRPLDIPDCNEFIARWKQLALENNIPPFYFIGHCLKTSELKDLNSLNLDAINLSLHHEPFNNDMSFLSKSKRYIRQNFFKKPEVVKYSQAIKKLVSPIFQDEKVFPTLIPNWDHTPRSGFYGRVYQDCTPQLFGSHIDAVLETIREKDETRKVIFVKSWNEWAEGNYLEPDLKYGKGRIDILKEKLFS